ncbi:MAG: PHB depolymerase family esterase, partial [Gammaproteobacteria bacterium]|nr:PHB depolymerase family esterase [Gammaproteobacteria bacterium]
MRLFQSLSRFTKDIYSGLKTRIGSFFSRWRALPPNDIQYTFRSREYPGSRMRRYRVHIPPNTNGRSALPLVMVLHGCRQDNEDIERISAFNEVADEFGFIVAYPYVTSYRGMRIINCWGWWFDREIHRGAGEVEDLWQIIEEIGTHHKINQQRIHVAGLSSGAAMTVAMLVAHADRIASGAAVAGLAYAERPEAVRHVFNRRPRNKPVSEIVSAMHKELGSDARTVPIRIVHSQNDETVDIQSAINLRDSWAQCFGIDTSTSIAAAQGRTGKADWEEIKYLNGSRKNSVIETFFLSGPG